MASVENNKIFINEGLSVIYGNRNASGLSTYNQESVDRLLGIISEMFPEDAFLREVTKKDNLYLVFRPGYKERIQLYAQAFIDFHDPVYITNLIQKPIGSLTIIEQFLLDKYFKK